jgi:two-component system chemotaxis response regulator CheY
MRILIVDDCGQTRRFIRRIAELSGVRIEACFEAADGREALDLLRAEDVDVVLIDMKMPVMDGEELIKAIRNDPALRSLPALVVSADADPQSVARMIKLGAAGYVEKPFSPDLLGRELRRVVSVPV